MESRKLLLICLIVFVLGCPFLLNAQVDQMKPFNALTGNWTVENYKLNTNQDWEFIGRTTSKISTFFEGKFVNENVKYLTASGEINMSTYIGYDSRIKSFKLSAMDKEFGVMDIYFGELKDEEIVFTNLDSDVPFKIDNGKSLWFKLTYKDISNDSFTHLVEGTTDQGKTWFVFSKAIYKKVI